MEREKMAGNDRENDFLEILMGSNLFFELPIAERDLLLKYLIETSSCGDQPRQFGSNESRNLEIAGSSCPA